MWYIDVMVVIAERIILVCSEREAQTERERETERESESERERKTGGATCGFRGRACTGSEFELQLVSLACCMSSGKCQNHPLTCACSLVSFGATAGVL